MFCRKSDPESKRKVENVVKYVKGNFLKGRLFEGGEKLNADCLSWLGRTGNGSMHHGIFRIPAEVFAEEVDGCLLVYSLETGKQIASHTVSQKKGQLVSDPAHKPLRGADVPEKEKLITDRVGDSETVSFFLADLAADKPRYYRKNLQLIIRSMDDYSQDTLRKAILTCLDRRFYNAKVLMEVAESVRKRNGEPLRVAKAPSGTQQAPRRDTAAIQPQKTDISVYNQCF